MTGTNKKIKYSVKPRKEWFGLAINISKENCLPAPWDTYYLKARKKEAEALYQAVRDRLNNRKRRITLLYRFTILILLALTLYSITRGIWE